MIVINTYCLSTTCPPGYHRDGFIVSSKWCTWENSCTVEWCWHSRIQCGIKKHAQSAQIPSSTFSIFITLIAPVVTIISIIECQQHITVAGCAQMHPLPWNHYGDERESILYQGNSYTLSLYSWFQYAYILKEYSQACDNFWQLKAL